MKHDVDMRCHLRTLRLLHLIILSAALLTQAAWGTRVSEACLWTFSRTSWAVDAGRGGGGLSVRDKASAYRAERKNAQHSPYGEWDSNP